MTTAQLTQLLIEFGMIGGLLLLGVFLRAKLRLFQNLFLPASVIGGFIGLLLCPTVLGKYALLPFSEQMMKDFAIIPGVLIVPVITAVPLGMALGKKAGGKAAWGDILPMLCMAGIAASLQYGIGFGTNLLFSKLAPGLNLYPGFGIELASGFAGGHGTAGLVGNMLKAANLPYWQTAQGVALTSATVGLIGGILLGMGLINGSARKGRIANLPDPKAIPDSVRRGYESDPAKQRAAGRETTYSDSIDSLAFHAAIVFGVCALAYGILRLVAKVPVLSSLSVWVYGILVMMILNLIVNKAGLDWLVDGKTKNKLTGFLVDFSIVAAIVSIPVKAVLAFWAPMLFTFVLGFLVTWLVLFPLSRRFYKSFAFERSIALWGQSTGVVMTGILLLRVCDPEMKTPVLQDFGLAYSFNSLLGFALLPLIIKYLERPWVNLGINAIVVVAYLAVCLVYFLVSARRAGAQKA